MNSESSQAPGGARSGTLFVGTVAGFGLLGLIWALNEVLPGPDGAQRFYDRGLGYYKERKDDDAKRWFSRAIEVNPNHYQAYFSRALVHRRDWNMEAAIADNTTVIRLKPDHDAAFYNRGLSYRDLGDPDKAIGDFREASRLKPEDPDAHQQLAALYRDLGDLDHALAEHDALIKLGKGQRSDYLARAALRRDHGDLAGAIRDADAALAADPTIDAYLARGRLRRELGDMDGAIADVAQAMALKPLDLRPTVERGEIDRQMGRLDAAMTEFDEAVKRAPDNATGYVQRGATRLFLLGDAASAAEDLNTAVLKGFEYQSSVSMVDSGISYMATKYGIALPRSDHGPWLAPDVLFHPAIEFLVVWRHLARSFSGQANAAELETALWRLEPSSAVFATVPVRTNWRKRVNWPGHIVALFAGKTTPDIVRDAATAAPGAYQRRLRICEADFYIAEYHLAGNQPEEARRLLQSAVDGCPAGAAEAAFARSALGRLGS